MEVVNTARTRQQLNESERSEQEEMGEVEEGEGGDTWVFPLVQMKPLGIQVDEQITQVGLRFKKKTKPDNNQELALCMTYNIVGVFV